jgi:pyridoxamine 5'-phosphate oxidase
MEKDAPDNPFKLFEKWFQELIESEVLDPYAFTLATARSDGRVSARVLYMRDINFEGLSFFTNYNSQKGHQIAENGQACANFYWPELNRQVRFTGSLSKLPESESDAYFASRPRSSQIGAWASDQSSRIADRDVLSKKIEELEQKYANKEVPRPPHWGGYRLSPDEIEFWQGRESRLHDRLIYTRKETASWELGRLSP